MRQQSRRIFNGSFQQCGGCHKSGRNRDNSSIGGSGCGCGIYQGCS